MRKTPVDTHTSRLARLIGFVVIFASLFLARDIFIPLALALLLTFVLSPVADWLERWRFPRPAAAVSVVIVLCLFTVGLGWVVGDQVARFAQDLPQYKEEIARKYSTLRGTGSGFAAQFTKLAEDVKEASKEAGTEGAASPPAATPGADQQNPLLGTGTPVATREKLVAADQQAKTAATQPVGLGASTASPLYVRNVDQTTSPLANLAAYADYVLSPLGTAGLVLVLLLFMLLERDTLRDRFIRLISSGRYTVTTQALNDATSRVGRYLRAQLIVNGSYGVTVALGLWAMGAIFGNGTTFPSFILWGGLCAVLRFIPYVGPWVAAVFPIAVSLAVYEGFGVFIATVSMFVVIELLSNNIMEPMLYGSSTGLSTVALLVAAIVWTWLWGPVGLLLATPLTVCLVVMGKYVPQLKFLDVLLGDQPALPPSVRFYQRLLAGSHADAAAVAREAVDEEGDPAAMVDHVIVPALRLARHDRRADEMSAEEELKFYEHVSSIAVETLPKAAADERRDGADAAGTPGGRPAAGGDPPLLIGLPAHHRSEMIIVQMLTELVMPLGGRVEQLSCSLLPADVESRVGATSPAGIFIAVIPPGGTTQARYLCRRLRRRYKDLPIVVGFFGPFRDYDRLLVRFRAAGASHVTTSLEQSRSQVAAMLGLRAPAPHLPRTSAKGRAGGATQPGSLCGPDVPPTPVPAGPAVADVAPIAGAGGEAPR